MKGRNGFALVGLVALVVGACSERLAAPAPCKEPCLAAPQLVQDTIAPLDGADSSFAGYILRDHELTILVSNGLPAADDRAYVRFVPRATFIVLGSDTTTDTLAYTVDSVAFRFNLVVRDTLALGDTLYLYQLAPTVDSTVEYPEIQAGVTDPTKLLASIPIPDSVHSGILQTVLTGPDLARLQIPVADSGKLSIGLRLGGPSATGVILSGGLAANSPLWASFVTADTADTLVQHQIMSRAGFLTGTRAAAPVVPDNDHITLGGIPSSRAIFRFELPKRITDTGTVVKAKLILIPIAPINGLPHVSARVAARNALTDLGRKSPVSSILVLSDSLNFGTSDTVSLPVTTLVRSWGGTIDLPHILVVSLNEEGGSFAQPIFGSTRTPGFEPRLIVTYSLPYIFSRP
ncbi:MAG: hypothetical protein ABI765_09300 [Gemmatimonadota bacterium]